MGDLSSLLRDAAARWPARTCVVDESGRHTYGDVDQRADTLTAHLAAQGLRPGDRAVLLCANGVEFVVAYNALLRAGATVVPLNTQLRSNELAYHLRDAAPTAILHDPAEELGLGPTVAAALAEAGSPAWTWVLGEEEAAPGGAPDRTQPLVARGPKDTAVMLYSSGTTGHPKGAELTHANMLSNVEACRAVFATTPVRPDVYLCALPLFHAFGQTVLMNQCIATGGALVTMRRFAPQEAIDLMVRESVTFFSGVPTMFVALLGATPRTSGLGGQLRVANSGGAALAAQVHSDFLDLYGVSIAEGYGLSETAPVVSFTPLGGPAKVGSIGTAIPGVEMRLVDQDGVPHSGPDAVGEIAVRGPNVMKGYWLRPEATAEVLTDGWFRTGDLARVDEDGYYYIVDRLKDVILRGGYNVYPREIEEALMTHPDIAQAAVVGVPDERLGEEILACVVPREDSVVSADDVRRWIAERVSPYKCPRLVEIRDSLPMTSTGKLLKRALSPTT